MTWPQAVVLAMMVGGFILTFVTSLQDEELTSAGATLVVFIKLAAIAIFAGALHAGGFW